MMCWRSSSQNGPVVSRVSRLCRCKIPTRRSELTRCIKDLGFKGTMVNGFSQVGDPNNVVYLDDPRYEAFWAKLEELDYPLYLHPRDPLLSREPILEGHPWLWGSAWAFV